MKFFDDYKKEIETLYKIKYNKSELDDTDKEKIDKYYKEKIETKYKPTTIVIKNTTIQEIGDPAKEIDFISYYDSLRNNNAVFSLSHAAYKDADSEILRIWDQKIKDRTTFKNLMKDALKNNEAVKANLYNNYQKVFKENANALYGVFGESRFVFYDLNNISNLTGTCFYVLLTTINEIEKILGNRILLRNEQEVFDYLIYLKNKDVSGLKSINDTEIYNKALNKLSIEDKEYVFEKFKKYIVFNTNDTFLNKVKTIIDDIFNSNDNERKMVFKYNCNFVKLIEDTQLFKDMINLDFDNFISNDFNEHAFKEKVSVYKQFLENTVYDDFLQANLLDLADNYKRSTVMLTDTDSTFCVTNDVFNNLFDSVLEVCNERNIKFDTKEDYKVHTFKLVMFIGETMSDMFLKTLAGPTHQNSKDNRWKLKSEFLYNKILLMKVKKTYFGTILSQEGIRLTPMKLDNKNTELVRSRYSKFTKEFIKEIYDELVSKTDEFDIYRLSDIMEDYYKKFDEKKTNYIEVSNFGSRADFKLEKAYKNDAIGVYTYKAALLFNCLYPEFKNMPADKTMIIDIKNFKFDKNLKTNEEIINWYIETYGVNDDLKTRFKNFFYKENKTQNELKLIDKMIEDKNIGYLAFNYYGSMPESMLDIVDLDSIKLKLIDDRMIRIFDALRLKTYSKSSNAKQKNYYTNIISI